MYFQLKHINPISLLILAFALSACNSQGSNNAMLSNVETEDEKAGYAAGYNTGASLKAQNLGSISAEAFYTGMMHALEGDSSLIPEAEQLQILQNYQQSKRDEVGKVNMEEGEAFLQKNKDREEVTVTDSGLQYEILVEGDGAIPNEDDKVKVHYHGTLINGKVFDSSVERGTPAEFGVTQVIPGWVEVLQLMPVGSKWKVYIPSDLAYGARGAGQDIGPNTTLIFEIELLEIL